MKRSVRLQIVVAATMALLAAGCSTRRGKPVVTTTPSGTEARGANAAPKELTDEEFETRIKAYANFAAGISADLNEDEAAALDHWIKSARADPDHEVLMLTLGARLIAARQSDKAIVLLSRSSAAPDASPALFNLLGAAYLDTGQTNMAVQAYRNAIRRARDDVGGYRNLFVLYRETRQLTAALDVLDEAAAGSSRNPAFWVELAELFAQYSQLHHDDAEAVRAKAVAALNRGASLLSGVTDENQMLVLKLADGYRLMGDRAQAVVWYLQLADRMPPFARIREKLADIYLRDGNKDKAAEQLRAIAKDNPRNEQVYYLLGTIASQEKRYADAANYLEQAISLRPDFKPAYYDLAAVKITLNKPEDALQILAKGRAQFGQEFLLEFYSGLAYMRLKQYPEAVRSFTEAEVIGKAGEPERLTYVFYHEFGAALERKGEYAEAEKYFRKSLELSPNFAETLNYLGYMWAERGDNLKEAREMIEKAVALEPDNAAYLDSLAWVLFKLGDPRKAVPLIEKAVQRSEEPDATLYDHLGDIYSAAGQKSKAREAWRKSLAVEFNEQISRKLRPAETGTKSN